MEQLGGVDGRHTAGHDGASGGVGPYPSGSAGHFLPRAGEGRTPYEAPPHLPVLTLKLPQANGLRQSAIRSREPSR